jgi:hypothetical protein
MYIKYWPLSFAILLSASTFWNIIEVNVVFFAGKNVSAYIFLWDIGCFMRDVWIRTQAYNQLQPFM